MENQVRLSSKADFVHWAFRKDRWTVSGELPFSVAFIKGEGPFGQEAIWDFVRSLGAEAYYAKQSISPDLLVLGREGVNRGKVRELIERKRGDVLRICSQEMLMAWSMTGIDPNSEPQTAKSFVDGHGELTYVADLLGGDWPSTGVIPHQGGSEEDRDQEEEGPLRYFGYSVAQGSDLTDQERRQALRRTLESERGEFPDHYPDDKTKRWGAPGSSARLRMIASELARQCRAAKKKLNDTSVAVGRWEDDLNWLKDNFYNPITFSFRWPQTDPE